MLRLLLSKTPSFLTVFFLIFSSPSWSCTRLLHVDKKQATIVGRNMDWFQDMSTTLTVYPRGIARSGSDAKNALKWVSKFGSIAAVYYDLGPTDGMNEKGLSAHILWLDDADYGKRNETVPGLNLMMWVQFYLDNFQTVDEAVRYTKSHPFQLLAWFDAVSKKEVKLHLALEDAKGDSAVIEYKNGLPVIYHSSKYNVLTNEPTYDVQLENVKQYEGLGGDKTIPGTDTPSDRFVRAAWHEKKLPAANSVESEVHGMLSILENVGHPYEYYNDTTNVRRTLWRTISDLTHHVYYFISTKDFTMNSTSLDQFNLNPGAPVMRLNLTKKANLSGDVTKNYTAAKLN